jgi:Fur family zinc uptake transcriptional regulator
LSRGTAKSPRLASKRRKLAEARCAEKGARLTPARLAAYEELSASDRPLSAYELISLLEQRQGRKIAPLTVYRHLEFLTKVGLVHRLESKQSYVTCEHPDHVHESHYLLCSSCGHVEEVESKPLESLLSKMADQHGFQPKKAVVEITGLCGGCATSDAD